MKERKEINMVLQKNPEIDGHDESNFIFTDISKTATNRVSYKNELFMKIAVYMLSSLSSLRLWFPPWCRVSHVCMTSQLYLIVCTFHLRAFALSKEKKNSEFFPR